MMSADDRRRAAELMRNALALLDLSGEQRAVLHLQLALDLLEEEQVGGLPGRSPTCH